MWKATFVLVLFLAAISCCMGQTFQYSRGWTNGKRSDAHATGESNEMIIDAEWEKKFEKCLYTLHRITQIPYLRNILTIANRKFTTQHHRLSPDGSDDIFGGDSIETRLKRHVNGLPA